MPLIFNGFYTFYFISFAFLLIFVRFRDSQDVLGVLEGPRRGLGCLGSSPGRFWDLLGRPGRVPGRRPIMILGSEYVTNTCVLEIGRFSVTCRGVWILFFCFYVLLSVLFVNRGSEFVVKLVKFEGFQFGPLRNFQEKNDEQVGFGRWIMGSQYL